MEGKKVVATMFIPHVDMGEGLLAENGAELVRQMCRTGQDTREAEDELIRAAGDADVVVSNLQPFTRRVLESLPRCRFYCAIGVGYDWIDVEAATEMGICVGNVPDYCVDEVSDHAMALLLACSRKLVPVFDAVRAGLWDAAVPVKIRQGIQPPMFRMKGQVLGLIGFGNIARCLVPKAQSFGLRVIACDPYAKPEMARDYGVELVGLDRLLGESDYISVHAALTKDNRHMLGQEQFRRMKPTAYFINTARGALVDESALYTALKEGRIAGAGLDVVEQEPPQPDNPMFELDNVVITAHMAQYSNQAEAELWLRPAEEAVRVFRGEWPRGLVNPQVKDKYLARWGTGGG
jgi:D-3-phosphoglycerate dehydrogenase